MKYIKRLFGKVTSQTGFFAPGPTKEKEQKVEELLFVRSANASLSLKVLNDLKRRFPKAKITMFSTWTLDSNRITDSELYDDLVFIPLEHNKSEHRARKKDILKKLKSRNYPLIAVIFSPDFIYYRMQLLPFVLRRTHLLIYNENIDSFYFNNYQTGNSTVSKFIFNTNSNNKVIILINKFLNLCF